LVVPTDDEGQIAREMYPIVTGASTMGQPA
jgi:hypothetical protein